MTLNNLNGLTKEEVAQNRLQFGTNASLPEKQSRFWHRIKDVVTEPLFIMLVCAAAIYLFLGEVKEGIVMIAALCFVSGISLYQETRSRNAVNALKKLTSPLCQVIRDGLRQEIDAQELVMHDLIVVEDGNIVPADATILEAHDCTVNESMLTGESLPVVKSSESPFNLLHQGTIIMTGSSIAKVSAIGKNTALGKIGKSLEVIEVAQTPLQLQIRKFVRSMVGIGIIAFILVWGINYYITKSILQGFLHGLTLAMSILPEEIPVAFSTFMALGAYHLYKKKVIARSPHTVETLGAATVICTDKTGTLTENEMNLASLYDFKSDRLVDLTKESGEINDVLEYAMWASEPVPFDRMEKSLHQYYETLTKNDKRKNVELVHEYPLSGSPPMMTHVYADNQGGSMIACKGGLETVISQCKLEPAQVLKIKDQANKLAGKGYRVLAVASGKNNIRHLPLSQHDLSFEMLGLVAFYDPPKKNSARILNDFYQAGIKVKMITGDYVETALAIARQIGMKIGTPMLTGEQVMAMNPNELKQAVEETTIFSRMYPDAKLRVVEALKANGEVVAMTGDGVNDGPALKAANIGIAMGLRGSELAKKASALILSDDNLEHMVEAITLGRRIYENLKKAIQYIISIHIPIILIVTIPLLAFWKYAHFFTPIHVIFFELIMGPTCSIIFENEPIEADSMRRKPRKMSNTFFSFRELSISIIQGLAITAACLGLGFYFMKSGHSESVTRTIIFTTLILSNIFLTLVNRSFRYSVFTTIRYRNKLIPLIISVSLLVLFLTLYVPAVRDLLVLSTIEPVHLLMCLAVSVAGVGWVEFFKKARPV